MLDEADRLLEKASTIGASGGYLGYVTIDGISFEEMEDMSGDLDGAQIGLGLGIGIDVHMMESYTKEIHSYNIFQTGREILNNLFKKENNKKECVE